jgi:hypothetical protein
VCATEIVAVAVKPPAAVVINSSAVLL